MLIKCLHSNICIIRRNLQKYHVDLHFASQLYFLCLLSGKTLVEKLYLLCVHSFSRFVLFPQFHVNEISVLRMKGKGS